MGNGGLCGGRGDNKASNTSEASPLPQSNQRYFNHEKSTLVSDIRPKYLRHTILLFSISVTKARVVKPKTSEIT